MDPLSIIIATATALRCQRAEVAGAIARALAAVFRSLADLAEPLIAGDMRAAVAAVGASRLRPQLDALVAAADAADAPLDPVVIAADHQRLGRLATAAGVEPLDGSVMHLLTILEGGLTQVAAALGQRVAERIEAGLTIDEALALEDAEPADTPGRLVAAMEVLEGEPEAITVVTAALLDVVGVPVGQVLPDLEDADLSDVTGAPTVADAVDAARQIAAEAL